MAPPAQRSPAARSRKNSAFSENYANIFIPENLGDQFSHVQRQAPRRPALNTEQRNFRERVSAIQNVDPNYLSSPYLDIIRSRQEFRT